MPIIFHRGKTRCYLSNPLRVGHLGSGLGSGNPAPGWLSLLIELFNCNLGHWLIVSFFVRNRTILLWTTWTLSSKSRIKTLFVKKKLFERSLNLVSEILVERFDLIAKINAGPRSLQYCLLYWSRTKLKVSEVISRSDGAVGYVILQFLLLLI